MEREITGPISGARICERYHIHPDDWPAMDAERAATQWDALARWIEVTLVPWGVTALSAAAKTSIHDTIGWALDAGAIHMQLIKLKAATAGSG